MFIRLTADVRWGCRAKNPLNLANLVVDVNEVLEEAVSGDDHHPETSMILAKKWLDICLTEHEKCKSIAVRTPQIQLPARLIEIGVPAPDMVRLWACPKDTELTSYPRYMTLSHCWGSAQFLTLNTKTFEALGLGISVLKLPQTFRDAIYVANQMGANFLWIDSLCILQDSVSDWEQEASRMSDVYSGSICNIAATGAANADAGCLYKGMSTSKPCIVNTTWNDELNDEYYVEDRNFWEDSFESDPLRQRAWVIQELLLSPRVLHLGKTQVFWECYQAQNCEIYPNGLPRSINSSPKVPLEEMIHPQQKTLSFLDSLWKTLVHKYTSCKLTRPEDKLVALSGIVKILQQKMDDGYYAGLWMTDLPAQLLWTAAWDQTGPLMPAREYRAPSWSWACVDGRIWVSSGEVEDVLVNIVEVVVKAVSPDLTGKVASGLIRLSGQLSTAEVQESPIGKWLPIDFYYIRFHGRNWAPLHSLNRTSLEPPHNLHCLAISRKNKAQVNCLLLTPTKARKGEFRRWGSMIISGDRNMRSFDDSGHHHWLEYENFDGKSTYTISII